VPHNNVATSTTPALIIYLLDCSGSMGETFDGAKKIEHLNEALHGVLRRMVQRSTKGNVVAPRYNLALIPYSDRPRDVLSGIKTIKEVWDQGRPNFAPTTSTDTAEAFRYALNLLQKELPNLNGHPAPMVCHLTDGAYTGDDPEPIARQIMQLSNDDGNVLVENIFIAPNLTRQPISDASTWPGFTDVSELDNPYAAKLFNMSSELPAGYAEVVQADGYGLKPGCRMLIPGTSKELVELAFAMSGATPTR
jgi:hypothetical protein